MQLWDQEKKEFQSFKAWYRMPEVFKHEEFKQTDL